MRDLLRPAIIASLIVGCVLTAANQGVAILEGTLNWGAIFFNYLVPFCVAGTTAYFAQQRSRRRMEILETAWQTEKAALSEALETETAARERLETAAPAAPVVKAPAKIQEAADPQMTRRPRK